MVLVLLVLFLKEIESETAAIDRARQSLREGKYTEALSLYDQSIRENPNNFQAYYLRGYLYEILGKYPQSVSDLTRCIELNPSFDKAKINRIQIWIKQGNLKEADSDLKELLKSSGDASTQAQTLKSKISDAMRMLADFENAYNKKIFKAAADISAKIIEICPLFVDFRKKRVKVFEALKDTKAHAEELKFISQLLPNDLTLLHEIAQVFYANGDVDEANLHVKKCLQRDQDHKQCRSFYKKLKSLTKLQNEITKNYESSRFSGVVEKSRKLKEDSDNCVYYTKIADSYLCLALHKLKNDKEALPICSKVIELNPEDLEARLVRAKIYESSELYEDAKSEYSAILDVERNHRKANEGFQRVERILKGLKRPDYYKILNVSKTSTTQEIERSYRRLVKKWHPDHYKDEKDIKIANVKLQELNRARQVLVDPENRRRFDEGYDPMDPQDQQHMDHGRGGGFGDSHGSFFNFFRGGQDFGGDDRHFRFVFN